MAVMLNYLSQSYSEVVVKKLFTLSAFLFIPIIALLFVQCSESTIDSNDQALSLNKGGIGEVAIGNNLSFPARVADDFPIIPIAATTFDVPYTGAYEELTADEIALLEASGPWYAQKVDGNVWQAEYTELGAKEEVSFVDWSDNIESFNPRANTSFRLEVTLYKELVDPMTGYKMGVLAFPNSPSETQGTNTTTYDSYLSTMVSNQAKLVVQHYDADPSTLVWNGTSWDGTVSTETVVFAVELNVGGKLIYGAASGGWKPQTSGKYRLTFYLPSTSEIVIGGTTRIDYVPASQVAFPAIVAANNLSYIDIVVDPRTTGGGK